MVADIEAYLQRKAQEEPVRVQTAPPASTTAEKAVAATPMYPNPVSGTIPLTGVRGVIANRMSDSSNTTAPVTLLMETDATELVKMRAALKAQYSTAWGFTPSYNDILAKITRAGAHRISLHERPHQQRGH